MGRPYAEELQELRSTYAGALATSGCEELSAFIGREAPLLLIGSGGAYSAARFMANAYEQASGQHARLATPLEVIVNPSLATGAKALFVSAGGSNKDILAAFAAVTEAEPDAVFTLCATARAKLIPASRRVGNAKVVVAPMGGKKDGFLALNSILSFCVIFSRACSGTFGAPQIPTSFDELMADLTEDVLATHGNQLLWKRRSVTVLYGTCTQPAAVDLESKCTEAGLSSISLSDHRNFGHGRHHWLAKHADDAAIMAFSNEVDRKLATATLKLIPAAIPRLHVTFSGSYPTAALRALVAVFYLTQQCAAQHKLDPGRPGVPPFGSKVYSLGPSHLIRPTKTTQAERAATRKARALGRHQCDRTVLTRLSQSAERDVTNSDYRGLVLDYDGTIVDPTARFSPIDEGVAKELTRILKGGVPIAICTGRGKSVHERLAEGLPPRFHESVLVCFYNGSLYCRLTEAHDCMRSALPSGADERAHAALSAFTDELRKVGEVVGSMKAEFRPTQISVSGNLAHHRAIVGHLLERPQFGMLKCVASSHSLDIIPVSSSKTNAVTLMRKEFSLPSDSPILCVGDMGEWPGNDSQLLDSPHGLSVSKSTAAVEGGWNFSGQGRTHAQALLDYLMTLEVRAGVLRWRPKGP